MADGSVPITSGSGTPVRALTNPAVQSGAFQQVMSLAGQDGALSPTDPDGTLQVSPEPAGLFIDDFSATLSTANWTTGGTAPVASGGTLTTASGTGASLTSYMRTVGAFLVRSGSYLLCASLVKLETAALVNNSRWWGLGINQTTPTAVAPVLNGAVFLLDYADGLLYAATYSAGARVAKVALTRPTDGAYHRYEIRYRQSVIYWIIDGLVVATVTQPNLAVAAQLPYVVGSVNFTTAPTAGPSLSVTSVGVSDLSGTHKSLGDGAMPWIQSSVKSGATAVATTDNPLVVALHPSTGLPSGSSTLGSVSLNVAQQTPYTGTSTASTNAAVIKASAGSLLELNLSNPTATAAFVKLYNKASAPTVGTDVPIATFRLAASGTEGDHRNLVFGALGKRFAAGIAIAITAAAAATDTAVTVAGIQVHGSYV